MRTSQMLRQIADRADALREARGDVLWSDSERLLVDAAFHAFAAIATDSENDDDDKTDS